MYTLTQLAALGRPALSSDYLCLPDHSVSVWSTEPFFPVTPALHLHPLSGPLAPCSVRTVPGSEASFLSQARAWFGNLHSLSQTFPQSSLPLADQSRPRTQPLGKMERIHFNPVVVDGHKTLWSFGLNISHGLTLDLYSNDPHCFR